jgi:hypothetical protein
MQSFIFRGLIQTKVRSLPQEVLTGCVASIGFSCWLTFGALFGGVAHAHLPASVGSCTAVDIVGNVTSAGVIETQTTLMMTSVADSVENLR